MLKSKVLCICFILIMLNIPFLYCQLEDQIDLLLEEEHASFGKAVYLVLVASDICGETATLDSALGVLKGKNWGITVKEAENPITLGEYSHLLMKAFNIPGGLLYMLIPGPRYAVRELAYHKLILEDPYPERPVSGNEVMTILTRLIDWKEGL